MLFDDFCNWLKTALETKSPNAVFRLPENNQSNDKNTTTIKDSGAEKAEKKRRLIETIIVNRVFGRAKRKAETAEVGLYAPADFYNASKKAQFFGFFPGKPDRIFSKDRQEGLCVEFKIYRKNPDDDDNAMHADDLDSSTDSSFHNNGYDIRNGFLQLLEYMLKDGVNGQPKPCQEGALVVFDKLHKSRPKWLSHPENIGFFLRMALLFKTYGFDVGLIWIWAETDSEGVSSFHFQTYKFDRLGATQGVSESAREQS